jgi:hypothetical protein
VYGIVVNLGMFCDNNYIVTVLRDKVSDKARSVSFNSFSKPLVRSNRVIIERTIDDIIRSSDTPRDKTLYRVAEFLKHDDGRLEFTGSSECGEVTRYSIKSIKDSKSSYLASLSVDVGGVVTDAGFSGYINDCLIWTNPNTPSKVLKKIVKLYPDMELSVDISFAR